MNKLSLLTTLLVFFIFTIGFTQEEVVINYNAPEIKFETEIIDLGTFMQYDDPSSQCEFTFTNTGKEPLIISKAKGSCGCTVPEWPEEEILPGEEAIIHVTFNSQYKSGRQNKTVTLITNATPSIHVFTIIGEIVEV